MGFKVPTRLHRLVFDENSTLAGLEVTVKTGTVHVFLEMSKLVNIKQGNVLDPATLESVRNMITTFSDVLVSWNVEDEDGTPLDCTADVLYEQDLVEFVMPIIDAWLNAITGVSRPLEPGSSDIDKELEATIPMTPLASES